MSLTMHQLLTDASKLANRLKERDSAADQLLSQTQLVCRQIDAMKHYADDLVELNEGTESENRAELIAGMQQEDSQCRELRIENRELKMTVQDYQNAVELIMSKYRAQSIQLIAASKIDYRAMYNESQNALIEAQANKINEMTAIIARVSNMVEEPDEDKDYIIARLRKENEGLRQLLEISCQCGSLQRLLRSITDEADEVKQDQFEEKPNQSSPFEGQSETNTEKKIERKMIKPRGPQIELLKADEQPIIQGDEEIKEVQDTEEIKASKGCKAFADEGKMTLKPKHT